MIKDSPTTCNYDYCYTMMYSIYKIIALFQVVNNYVPEQMHACYLGYYWYIPCA